MLVKYILNDCKYVEHMNAVYYDKEYGCLYMEPAEGAILGVAMDDEDGEDFLEQLFDCGKIDVTEYSVFIDEE